MTTRQLHIVQTTSAADFLGPLNGDRRWFVVQADKPAPLHKFRIKVPGHDPFEGIFSNANVARLAAIAQAANAQTLHPAVAQDLGGLVREQHAQTVAGLDAQQVIWAAQRATVAPAAAPAPSTSVPTLSIGTIKERLAHMTVTAENLRALGFDPAGRERAASKKS
jgi:hypothetical protein